MRHIEGHFNTPQPKGAESWDIDPYEIDVLLNPKPFYDELRDKGDVVFLSRYNVLAVGRYDPTRIVFSDHKRFLSSHGVGMQDIKRGESWRPASIILEVDPPDHTRTRKPMAIAMSPKVAKDQFEMFCETAEQLVVAALKRGEIDGVKEFAEVFPTTVFPKAVGMHDASKRHLIDYGAMVFNSVGPDNCLRQEATQRNPEIVPWITAACQRERVTSDGLGDLLYSYADTGELTEAEAALLMRSFLSAGVDTTVTGIGNALWCFANHPDQWKILQDDPSLIRPAFEEVLRFTSPVHSFFRTAGEDTELSGVAIEKGTKIMCVLGAANMDPEKWGDPEMFRIDRRPRGHLAFGVGIHGCVGQNIARA